MVIYIGYGFVNISLKFLFWKESIESCNEKMLNISIDWHKSTETNM